MWQLNKWEAKHLENLVETAQNQYPTITIFRLQPKNSYFPYIYKPLKIKILYSFLDLQPFDTNVAVNWLYLIFCLLEEMADLSNKQFLYSIILKAGRLPFINWLVFFSHNIIISTVSTLSKWTECFPLLWFIVAHHIKLGVCYSKGSSPWAIFGYIWALL